MFSCFSYLEHLLSTSDENRSKPIEHDLQKNASFTTASCVGGIWTSSA